MKLSNNTSRKVCPVCQCKDIKLIGSIDYGRNVKFGSVDVLLKSTPMLYDCRACKSWFSSNIVSEKDAVELYTAGDSTLRWSAEPFADVKSPEILRAINQVVSPGIKVIDIGCNTGELLDYCSARGAVTYGVELSSSSRSVCKAKGHSVFAAMTAVTGNFDVVLAFDLVEHLYDLRAFLESILHLLQKGGRLVILTGDNSSATAHLYRQNWWYTRYPEHIVFPSWKSWSEQQGFRVIRRVRTYASRSYRSKPSGRIRAFLNMLRVKGNGLPLISGDHHLIELEKL